MNTNREKIKDLFETFDVDDFDDIATEDLDGIFFDLYTADFSEAEEVLKLCVKFIEIKNKNPHAVIMDAGDEYTTGFAVFDKVIYDKFNKMFNWDERFDWGELDEEMLANYIENNFQGDVQPGDDYLTKEEWDKIKPITKFLD